MTGLRQRPGKFRILRTQQDGTVEHHHHCSSPPSLPHNSVKYSSWHVVEHHPPFSHFRVLSIWRSSSLQICCQQHNHSTSRANLLPEQAKAGSGVNTGRRREVRRHIRRWQTTCWTTRNALRNWSILEWEDWWHVELQVRGWREQGVGCGYFSHLDCDLSSYIPWPSTLLSVNMFVAAQQRRRRTLNIPLMLNQRQSNTS